ncbi:adenylyl-sulfate kinase [Aureitalea marina]|uniref:Adenylyl-sulfate kinase n=1 Tax=Aureitalea marina TaxID=930804 RepID=A0A2S7KNL8_9FLAO|nr:adenylyl-sulfate kinase [Aureitalea marina]PQB04224.1 adenylyl-sulfate kinase [Aureitalea marina]
MNENIIPHSFQVARTDREKLMGQKGCLLWFTGLSGSGKSTIANQVELRLFELGVHTYLLDGDNVRSGLNGDLGFTDQDRIENIRRIAEVANLMVDAGLVVLASFVSPFISDRQKVRETIGEDRFVEIYVNTPLEECERRDVKGLYAKARDGKIPNFTGIDSPYEAPIKPEIELQTMGSSVEESAREVTDYLASFMKQ